jgi:uncharacterized repeat protein (TIGR03803 family)
VAEQNLSAVTVQGEEPMNHALRARRARAERLPRVPLAAAALLVAAAMLPQRAAAQLVGYATFHSMSGEAGEDGQAPNGELISDTNGNQYGTNYLLGATTFRCECKIGGTVYKLLPKGLPTTLHTFSGPDGEAPSTGLTLGKDGFLYGMTAGGGDYGGGVIYKVDRPGTTFAVVHSFNGPANDGAMPWHGRLVLATDGNFYGTTSKGGAHGGGTVFRMTPAGVVTVLHHFAGGAADGAQPRGGLMQASDGNLYGTTLCGGAFDAASGCSGTVYRITPKGAFTLLHSFDANPLSKTGALPQATVTEAGGALVGATTGGGRAGFGTVFRMALDGSGFATVHDFAGGVMGATPNGDGAAPVGRLLLAADGHVYGTTSLGGSNAGIYPKGDGTIFRVSPAGVYETLQSLGGTAGDGVHPLTGLNQGSDGTIFGTAETGGANQTGSIFRFTPPVAQ